MKNIFKQYFPYLIEYKRQFIFAIIGMVAVAIGTAGSAHLIKDVLDEVFINKDRDMLLMMPFLIFSVFFLKGVGQYTQIYYMSFIGLDIVKKLRNNLVKHLSYQDMNFFTTTHTGEILSRITNDITRIQMVVTTMIPSMIRETFTIVALTGYVIYMSPKLSFYFLVVMPIALYPLGLLARKMKRYSKLSQESTANMTSRIGEIFTNIEVIKSNSTQEVEAIKFRQENQQVFKYLLKQVKVNGLTNPVMEVLGAIAIGLIIYIGGKEVIDGEITVGAFFAFATALFLLYTPLKKFSRLYNQSQDAIVANERMLELLNMQPTIVSGKIELKREIESIEFKNVSLLYDDIRALDKISIKMKKGESIALVGDSGAGKSSFVNLLVRFYDPTEGQIFINGIDSKNLTLGSLHARIAYVTQRIYIFNDTVANNVAYGEKVDKKRVIKALKKAHALEFVEKLEDGIETQLFENGSNLSGGERQRIALARALYKEPSVLILDEATSALDNKSEILIQKALESLKEGMITITVAHRLSTVESADTILVFKNGGIICTDTHPNLVEGCNEYRKLAKM